eukprot:768381-Hanusia_phi.AAC.6
MASRLVREEENFLLNHLQSKDVDLRFASPVRSLAHGLVEKSRQDGLNLFSSISYHGRAGQLFFLKHIGPPYLLVLVLSVNLFLLLKTVGTDS